VQVSACPARSAAQYPRRERGPEMGVHPAPDVEPGAFCPQRNLLWALEGIVCQHLSVARSPE